MEGADDGEAGVNAWVDLRCMRTPHLKGQRVWDLAPGIGKNLNILLQAPVHALDGLLPAAITIRIHEPARNHCYLLIPHNHHSTSALKLVPEVSEPGHGPLHHRTQLSCEVTLSKRGLHSFPCWRKVDMFFGRYMLAQPCKLYWKADLHCHCQ